LHLMVPREWLAGRRSALRVVPIGYATRSPMRRESRCRSSSRPEGPTPSCCLPLNQALCRAAADVNSSCGPRASRACSLCFVRAAAPSSLVSWAAWVWWTPWHPAIAMGSAWATSAAKVQPKKMPRASFRLQVVITQANVCLVDGIYFLFCRGGDWVATSAARAVRMGPRLRSRVPV
jgi:hypothetical protein